jgi:hypothetical protein
MSSEVIAETATVTSWIDSARLVAVTTTCSSTTAGSAKAAVETAAATRLMTGVRRLLALIVEFPW